MIIDYTFLDLARLPRLLLLLSSFFKGISSGENSKLWLFLEPMITRAFFGLALPKIGLLIESHLFICPGSKQYYSMPWKMGLE